MTGRFVQSAGGLLRYFRRSRISGTLEPDLAHVNFVSFARIFFCLALLCVGAANPLHAQITWTKVWSTSTAPAPNTYYNGYLDIHYDPYTKHTWIWSTDTVSGGNSIYSSRLHFFDDVATDTLVGSANQPPGGDCVSDSASWPGVRHPVGQVWVDTKRNR
jgi:hypothetical protein